MSFLLTSNMFFFPVSLHCNTVSVITFILIIIVMTPWTRPSDSKCLTVITVVIVFVSVINFLIINVNIGLLMEYVTIYEALGKRVSCCHHCCHSLFNQG